MNGVVDRSCTIGSASCMENGAMKSLSAESESKRKMTMTEIDCRPFWEICDQCCDVCEELDCPIVEDLKADYDDNDSSENRDFAT
jgi:hypothetical protein